MPHYRNKQNDPIGQHRSALHHVKLEPRSNNAIAARIRRVREAVLVLISWTVIELPLP